MKTCTRCGVNVAAYQALREDLATFSYLCEVCASRLDKGFLSLLYRSIKECIA
jgi:hypothetical protein